MCAAGGMWGVFGPGLIRAVVRAGDAGAIRRRLWLRRR
jgi:hypothetical protein